MSMSSSVQGEEEGTSAQVTGGSVFEILAGRKALKSPCEAEFVNSASATTGKKIPHCEALARCSIQNPSSVYERRYQWVMYRKSFIKRQQQRGITARQSLPAEILPGDPFYFLVVAGVEVTAIGCCYAAEPIKIPFDP